MFTPTVFPTLTAGEAHSYFTGRYYRTQAFKTGEIYASFSSGLLE